MTKPGHLIPLSVFKKRASAWTFDRVKKLLRRIMERSKSIFKIFSRKSALRLLILITALSITSAGIGILSKFNWSGFGEDSNKSISTEETIKDGKFVTTKKITIIHEESAKTLWDWLELLAVPVLLVILSYQFQLRDQKRAKKQSQIEKEQAEKLAEIEKNIANEDRRDDALEAYIDRISDLLLNKKLAKSNSDSPVHDVARITTLTVLRRLRGDNIRRATILLFLYDAGLLQNEKSAVLINLRDADFSEIKLSFANLRGANLTKANLTDADLRFANLTETNLTETNFEGADLTEANLKETNLTEAYLIGTNLKFANLEGANLTEANLENANLKGASLIGTNLTEVYLEGAKLEGAKYTNQDTQEEVYSKILLKSSITKFPQEFDPIAAKMVLVKNLNDLNQLS